MRAARVLVVVVLLAALLGCSRATGSGPRVLNGAGATLPSPLYSRWGADYAAVEPSVRINYQSVGSGAGIRQISDGVVDFGATDEPATDDQIRRKQPFLHVPMTIGAVVLAYQLPGQATLRLTPRLVAGIFMGDVTRWDDARIREVNDGAPLPAQPITVVHRADGSGTSAAFTAYLSKNSDAWRDRIGSGVSPRFPVGVGGRGNEGVTALVKSTPGAIGYVELAYARQANLASALIQNRAGAYVAPTVPALDKAARSFLGHVPADLRLSIVDSTDPEAYPIAALSFILVPQPAPNRPTGEAMAKFLWWAVHDGQGRASALDYAPLPKELVTLAEGQLRALSFEGQPLLASVSAGNGQ